MRYRIAFSKTEAMRYTSHLDLQRTLERTIRRAGLPLSYSQGFNPRPKLVIATALPLGITSNAELFEIWLEKDMAIDEVVSKLKQSAPPGIEIHHAYRIDLSCPKLPNLINAVIYEATLLESTPNLSSTINQLLSQDESFRMRRGKTYNLRPLINSLDILPENSLGQQRFEMSLKNQPGETGRPDEVLSALKIDPKNVLIHRKEIILNKNEENTLR